MLICRWLNYGINLPKLIKIRIMFTTNAENDINLEWSSSQGSTFCGDIMHAYVRDAFNWFFFWAVKLY